MQPSTELTVIHVSTVQGVHCTRCALYKVCTVQGVQIMGRTLNAHLFQEFTGPFYCLFEPTLGPAPPPPLLSMWVLTPPPVFVGAHFPPPSQPLHCFTGSSTSHFFFCLMGCPPTPNLCIVLLASHPHPEPLFCLTVSSPPPPRSRLSIVLSGTHKALTSPNRTSLLSFWVLTLSLPPPPTEFLFCLSYSSRPVLNLSVVILGLTWVLTESSPPPPRSPELLLFLTYSSASPFEPIFWVSGPHPPPPPRTHFLTFFIVSLLRFYLSPRC